MKKLLIIYIPLILLSCNSLKLEKIEKENKIQKLLDSKDIIVHFPSNWTYELNHNSIAYTPKGLNDSSFKCAIQVFKHNGLILDIWPLHKTFKTENEYKKLGMPIKTQTRFGNTDIYKVTNVYEKIKFKNTILIFHFSHNDNSYILKYIAEKKYYDKYLNDIDYFIQNLEFKKDK